MAPSLPADPVLTARALAWTRQSRESVCDRIEPWEHGTVLRASRYPRWFDLNLVRVEDDPGISAAELMAFADQALSGLEHRTISFEVAPAAEPLLADFNAAGWRVTRLIWMHHVGPRQGPGGPEGPELPEVREASYDAAAELRLAWHREDFPGLEEPEFHAQAREVALARGTRVLEVVADGESVGFSALDPGADGVEIGAVYVLPAFRGAGRGTALTQAAIAAADGVEHLWICADADDRPKELYMRLGFVPVLSTVDLLLLPR
jgi:GNAT superfamily N-acetyltransferase